MPVLFRLSTGGLFGMLGVSRKNVFEERVPRLLGNCIWLWERVYVLLEASRWYANFQMALAGYRDACGNSMRSMMT